jgi:hypothetical protein
VIESVLHRAQSPFAGRGRGGHVVREIRRPFSITLVDDKDGMKGGGGGGCISRRNRGPLNRRRRCGATVCGEEVRGPRTVIFAWTASFAGCARELFCPVVTLEGRALRRRKAIWATWAEGYRHEGRVWNSGGPGVMGATGRRWEGRTTLEESRRFALVETEFSGKTGRRRDDDGCQCRCV